MHSTKRLFLAEIALWVIPGLWASNYLIARAASHIVPPNLLAFGRWAFVFAVLLAWRGRALLSQRQVVRDEAPHLLVFGALGMWICGAWVYIAGHTTSATNIGLIYSVAPIGIAIGGAVLLRERLGMRQAIAMTAAVLGVLLIIFKGDPSAALRIGFDRGDLWVAGATLSWIVYSLLLKIWPTRLNPADRMTGSCLGGLVVLAPFAGWEWWHLERLPAEAYGLMLLAGLVPGLIAHLAYMYMQRELGVARSGLVLYLAPLYGALLAWAILKEAPQWFHLAGAFLILPGIRYASPNRLKADSASV